MSNTFQRCSSALVLMLVLGLILWMGRTPTLVLISFLGAGIIDEIHTQFFKGKRADHNYWANQLSYFSLFYYFAFNQESYISYALMILALLLNTAMLVYLFFIDIEHSFVQYCAKRFPFLIGLFIFFPMFCLGKMIFMTHWVKLALALLLATFSMDTGAWFFGKRFGKHKLWEKISPKKTIEGLLGGAIFSAIVATYYWWSVIDYAVSLPLTALLFFVLAILCQLGDLFESKLKRECNIKDSSHLIPGHGGIYDRVDGLIFIAPFYVVVLKLLF